MKLKRRGFVGMILATLSTGAVSAKSWLTPKPRSIYIGDALVFHNEKLLAPCEWDDETHEDETMWGHVTKWEPNGTEVKMSLYGRSKGRARSGALTAWFNEEADPEMMSGFKEKQRFAIRITPIPS